jgi:outer membrane protein OmpA-like peptidoglycan-associated protein
MFDRRVGSLASRRGQAALLCVLLLCGCSTVQRLNDSKLTLETPIDWWHDLQGGRIAQGRPPPPGATDPYPNLSSVPARPTPTDATTRRALTEQLAAERDRTQRAATRDPIVAAGAPAAVAAAKAAAAPKAAPAPTGITPTGTTPGKAAAPGAPAGDAPAGTIPAAAPDDEPSKAVLDAATAPPATAPPATPRRSARGAPAAGPGGASLASGPLPELPAGAPPIPQLPGLPATAFAPAAPRPLPQAVIAFARGSATLPDSADPALRALAARLAGGGMVVQAGGDADGAGPDQQAAAVPLGLARARAIRAALVAAGVPAAAIRIEAAGLGRTGSARLLP